MFISIILHFATFLSIIIYYRKELWILLKNYKSKTTIKLIISTLSTLIIVLLFKTFFINAFNGDYLAICFIITAILLFISEQLHNCHEHTMFMTTDNIITPQNTTLSFNSISNLKSFIVGIVQGFAVLPGISRSGSTIATLLILKANKEESANYSFIMSLPIILGSLIFEVFDFIKSPEIIPFNIWQTSFGFIITLITGYFSIKFLLKIIKKQKLYLFSFYLLILSLIIIIFNF